MTAQEEKSAIITGAAKRIGREIALALARRNYHIGLNFNRSESAAKSVKKEIEQSGVKCLLLPCDLNDAVAAAGMIREAQKQLPGLSVLVNNASVFARASFLETSLPALEENIAVHIRSPFVLTQEFARTCRHGNVINIVDTLVSQNYINYFAYSLTKKALLSFTQLAAKALAPEIRVNAIAPGSTMQPIDEPDESYMSKRAKQVPLMMEGNPQFVIKGINYLLDNAFVTGECLFIDGGVHIDC